MPDGRFQLAFSLADGPISALADPMGDGGGIAPSLLIGIRSRFSIIDTAKLRSAMGVVFRPGGVHAFLNTPADAFHDKNVSLDLIWGSMVQALRDRLRNANDPAKKFKILEVALLSRIDERAHGLDDTGAHILQAVLFAIGVLIMVAFIRAAQRVEPFFKRV